LIPSSASHTDLWRGWTVQTSNDGRLFYHHAATGTSQWQMPRELTPVLGEWKHIEENGESQGYWRNDLLGVSAWNDPRKTTNLFQAALDGDLFFLQLYAEVGGFLDAVDAKGRTALHYNCAGGSMQAVVYLLQRGASLEMPDRAGSTPLHWASRYGHASVVRVLLEASADPDKQNSLGDTCLHEAAALGRVEALQWLLMSRANPVAQNQEGRTPAEVAARNQQPQAEALLQENQARGRGRAWRGASTDESEGSDGDPEGHHPDPVEAERRRRKREQRREQESESGSGSDTDEPEPSLALVVVRAARPLLRGVQWLANRVLGEKRADLGDDNKFAYDAQTGQWVLRRDTDARRRLASATDGEDSASSEGDGEDEAPQWSLPERGPRLPHLRRKPPKEGCESDGVGCP